VYCSIEVFSLLYFQMADAGKSNWVQ